MKSTQNRAGAVSEMKELNEEIKLTIEMMQGDIDDGAHGELQSHLYSLLEMKRELLGERACTDMTVQIQVWPADAEERIYVIGQNGNDGEHNREALIGKLREEAELLRMQLAACGVVAMANTPESANKARAMHPEYMSASCRDVMGAVDREMALRDQISRQAELIHKNAAAEQIADEAKPLTVGELMAGGWWCADVSEDCANALKSKHLRVFNATEWGDGEPWGSCAMDSDGEVTRGFFDAGGNKQIHRVGNEFYWGDA